VQGDWRRYSQRERREERSLRGLAHAPLAVDFALESENTVAVPNQGALFLLGCAIMYLNLFLFYL
jgi:hypothetical protein